MTEYPFEFYHAANNTIGLSGSVGGGPGENLLEVSLNELLCPVDTNEYDAVTESLFQYRKFWIKQTAIDSYSVLRLGFALTEYNDRIAAVYTTGHGTGNTPFEYPISKLYVHLHLGR